MLKKYNLPGYKSTVPEKTAPADKRIIDQIYHSLYIIHFFKIGSIFPGKNSNDCLRLQNHKYRKATLSTNGMLELFSVNYPPYIVPAFKAKNQFNILFSDASLREIGRTVAAEVEKYFETSVNPETIKSKALRMQAGSNEPPTEKPVGGDSGDKPTIQDAAKIMDKEVQTGKSTREAARVAAEKTGQKEESVRKTHQRAEKKKRPEPEQPPIISDDTLPGSQYEPLNIEF